MLVFAGSMSKVRELMETTRRKKAMADELTQKADLFVRAVCRIADDYEKPRKEVLLLVVRVLLDSLAEYPLEKMNLDTGEVNDAAPAEEQ